MRIDLIGWSAHAKTHRFMDATSKRVLDESTPSVNALHAFTKI